MTQSARPVIKETIVVEGRDDESAVLRAVEADIICTHGYGINAKTLEQIGYAYDKKGIIIFTDPDFAGKNIRERLSGLYPNAKHAFLTRDDAHKDGDIGVENASPEAIKAAILAARAVIQKDEKNSPEAGFKASEGRILPEDMVMLGLTGQTYSAELRKKTGKILCIGSGNASAFLKRLNSFGITREELVKACSKASTENP